MESNHSNAAAIRSFRLMAAVADRPNGCLPAELVETLGLPKQTVHRLVEQLALAGLLMREPHTRRLQLGSGVERFALATLMNGPGRQERHAILRGVVEATRETCNLTVLAGADIVYLDRVETSWPLRMTLAPGSHVPLHATSSGKLLLSLLPKAQRDTLLRQLVLRGFTETTLVDFDALQRELQQTRKRRIGINRAEHLRGLLAVAVPVMVERQRACAAVALQAPEGRMSMDELLGFVPKLREAAAAIAATFRR